jgi:hypothetical protein
MSLFKSNPTVVALPEFGERVEVSPEGVLRTSETGDAAKVIGKALFHEGLVSQVKAGVRA